MILSLSLCGCGIAIPIKKAQSKVNDLRIGMSRDEIKQILGKPLPRENAPLKIDESVYEIERYYLYIGLAPVVQFVEGMATATFLWWVPVHWVFSEDESFIGRPYEMYFIDGKLAWWAKKGSRAGAPKEIDNFLIKSKQVAE